MKKLVMLLGSLLCFVLIVGIAACGDAKESSGAADAEPTSTTLQAVAGKVAGQGQWEKLRSVGQLPAARAFASVVCESEGDNMYFFGGGTGDTDYSDLWTYDPGSGRWTALNPEGDSPSPRELSPLVYDEVGEKIYLFGGWNEQDQKDLGDTCCYDPESNSWSEMETFGESPAPRDGHSLIYDPEGERIVLFGGSDQNGVEYDDTWAYDPVANTWTELEVSGDRPPARAWHCVAYDSAEGRMLIFGGADDRVGADLTETWRYDPAKGSWSEYVPEDAVPPGREDQAMVYDPVNGNVLMFGGMQINYQGEDFEFLNDIWEYECSTNTWLEFTPATSSAVQALEVVLPCS